MTSQKLLNYGFIGLGAMGSGMARNILEKVYYPSKGALTRFTVLDTSQKNIDAFLNANGEHAKKQNIQINVVKSSAEVAQQCEVVVTMLPTPQIVESVWMQMAQQVRTSQIFIDCSTIDPATSKRCNEALQATGSITAEAPVSGGTGGANAGTLTFMIGTLQGNYETIKSALSPMGTNFFHCGGYGTGQAAKICNNMMLAISMLGTSEALNLGAQLGIDPRVLSEIMNVSSGQSWSLTKYNPHPNILPSSPSSNSYRPGFGIKLMEKDLKLAVECGGKQTPIFLGKLALEVYSKVAASLQDPQVKDFSVVYPWLQAQSKKIN